MALHLYMYMILMLYVLINNISEQCHWLKSCLFNQSIYAENMLWTAVSDIDT